MSQDHIIKLQCTKCKEINYFSTRNRKQVPDKVELEKFCKHCRARTKHKEGKK
jgi:large subunit ribosomal protein L33